MQLQTCLFSQSQMFREGESTDSLLCTTLFETEAKLVFLCSKATALKSSRACCFPLGNSGFALGLPTAGQACNLSNPCGSKETQRSFNSMKIKKLHEMTEGKVCSMKVGQQEDYFKNH